MAKLTLSIDPSTVAKAKQLAQANGTSVSAMFSQFVESVANGSRRTAIGPLTRKLSGIVKLPPGKDYKELLAESLADRYGTAR